MSRTYRKTFRPDSVWGDLVGEKNPTVKRFVWDKDYHSQCIESGRKDRCSLCRSNKFDKQEYSIKEQLDGTF